MSARRRSSSALRRLAAVTLVALAASAPTLVSAAGSDAKTATEKPADAAKDKPGKDKPGKADKDAGPGPVDGGALPPGHPPIDEGLPEGHPSVDDEDEPHAGVENPHAGAQNPHAGARGGNPRFFEPPEDLAVDDPSLPPGTIVVTIKDADDKPIANAPIVVGILKSSVAQGDSRDRKALDVDAAGTARLDGLPIAAGTSYRVTTTRGPATYGSMPFALTDKSGKRVTLHAYDASANIEDVLVGAQAYVFVSLKEDVLSVEHLFNIFNIGKVAWVPGPGAAAVGLPEGYKAWTKPDEMGGVTFLESKGKGADLTGTIPPGRHEATFRYHIPLEGTERQTIQIELPPHVGEARIFAEASKSMRLEVKDFPAAQRQRGRDGRNVMVTMRQASQGERGIKTLEITIAGLPTHGPGRWIAVAFALCAAGIAITFVIQQKKSGSSIPEDAREELLEAREALLGEFVALEKGRKSGDIGPKTYERLRNALLDALARIESRLDEAKATRVERRRRERKTRGEGAAT